MKKQEFLSAFQRAMESLDVKDQAAHYGFFEELFSDMSEEGFTEEDISSRLGDPWELAASLLREEEGRAPNADTRSGPAGISDPAAPANTAPASNREGDTQGSAETSSWEKVFSWRNGFLQFLREPGKFLINMNFGSGSHDAYETRLPPSGIEELEINWRAGELELGSEDREDILLTEDRSGDDPPMRTEIRGSCLCVYYAERPCGSKDLTVMLPNSLAGRLRRCTVNAVSADVSLSGMEVEELSVNSTSGSQEIRLFAGRASFSSASGDQDLAVEAKELTARSASGDISLVNTSGTLVKLSTASGDIDFRGTADQLILNSASGDAEVSGHVGSVQVKTASGDCWLKLDNAPAEMNLSSVSGDVEVTLPRSTACCPMLNSRSGSIGFSGIRTDVQDAPVYRVQTVSGDIDIHD